MIVSLPNGIYGYHSHFTSRICISDIRIISSSSFCIAFFLSLLCSVSSVGAIIYIPPFIKFCFANHVSVPREKVHSPSSLTAVFYLYARQRSYAHADRVSLRCLCFARRVLFRGRIVCAFLLRHDLLDRCHRKVHRRISCRQVIQLCLRRHPLTRAKEIIVCMT